MSEDFSGKVVAIGDAARRAERQLRQGEQIRKANAQLDLAQQHTHAAVGCWIVCCLAVALTICAGSLLLAGIGLGLGLGAGAAAIALQQLARRAERRSRRLLG